MSAATRTYYEATKNFLCGQVVSVFSLMGLVMAKRLVYRDVNAPMLLNMFFYLFMAIVFTITNWIQPAIARGSAPTENTTSARAQVRWWFYPILALIDAQANICAVKSLEFVSFATTGLVLNLAVPFVFTLCVCVFGMSYKWKHCIGCLLTVIGSVVVLIGCVHRQETFAFGSDGEVYGWSLAVLAAALYAGSTVINQWCMKIRGVDEIIDCLSKVGAWGAVWCLLQVGLFERTEVSAVVWTDQVVMLFLGYVLCLFAFYTAVFVLVQATETTMYNLSLLFSSVYLMLMSHNALEETIDTYTCVAMMLMLVGLSIYTWTRAAAEGINGSNGGLPQISFKSMHTPREVREDELVLNKIRLAEV